MIEIVQRLEPHRVAGGHGGAADMRHHHHVVMRGKGRVAARLGHETIQPRRADMARGQRLKQCRLIHQIATRGVHDHAALGQTRQPRCIQKADGFGCGRAVQR